MKLVCHIGNLEGLFDIVQGATFSEDYNETLDSGNIIIVSKNRQLDIKPYDDVIIFDKDVEPAYKGWGSTVNYSGFYRHLLVDNFSEEMIYQGTTNNINTVDFKYKISLFSETKKLEKIIVPRLSVTQPLKNSSKKTILYHFTNFLNLYNPKIKVWKETSDWHTNWEYRPKYSYKETGVDSLEFADSIWCPEFTLGESNFRELLTELFQVADRIPYVKDDVIYALDISKTKGNFDTSVGQLNFPIRSMTSADYCTNLRTTYSDALPQEYSGHSVECIGFRNSDEAVLTLDNLRLELNFPIYKINHVYMHYYKNATVILKVVDSNGNQVGNTSVVSFFPVLITQDITKLVKMNNEPLSKDWENFTTNPISSIDDAAKYDFSTVRYAQGSKYITGWGDKYQYPVGPWLDTQTKTHIENIVKITDSLFNYGILNSVSIRKQIEEKVLNRQANLPNGQSYKIQSFTIPQLSLSSRVVDSILKNFFGTTFGATDATDTLKDILFTIDYQPFYNGSVVHSKGFGDVNENLTSIDNPNNSLCLLERDGVAQREKLERFGVQAVQLNARYTDVNSIQPVGTRYSSPYTGDITSYNNDKDKIIIYHREYSIFDNVVNCTYFGSQEYVLKNYYTSVFSKYRVYNLMSYGESVRRTENEKYYIYLDLVFDNNEQNEYVEDVANMTIKTTNFAAPLWLSGILPTIRENGTVDARDNILNNAYYHVGYYQVWTKIQGSNDYEFKKESDGYFATDLMAFSTGNSLVFNASMVDNIVGGTYWEKSNVSIDWVDNTRDDLKGTTQNQYYIAKYDDGSLFNIEFGFTHKNQLGLNSITKSGSSWNINGDLIRKRPLLTSNEITESINHISIDKIFYKDNKELIDFSLQFEYVTKDKIFISPWFGRLNDLVTNFYKQLDLRSLKNTSITSINSIYLGLTYEGNWYTTGSQTYIDNYSNLQYTINYDGETISQTPNYDLGKLGFGHNYVNGAGNGKYYMSKEYYKHVTGRYPNEGGFQVQEYYFSNPVLVFGIDKNIYNSAPAGKEFSVKYEFANFAINCDFGRTKRNNKGNPYHAQNTTNSNLTWVQNAVVSIKNIHIKKGSSKTSFLKEDFSREDKSYWTDTKLVFHYQSKSYIEGYRTSLLPYYDDDLGCYVIKSSDTGGMTILRNIKNNLKDTTISIDGEDPHNSEYFVEFDNNSTQEDIAEYLDTIRDYIYNNDNKTNVDDPELNKFVFIYSIQYQNEDNAGQAGTYHFISFDPTFKKGRMDIPIPSNIDWDTVMFESYRIQELMDYVQDEEQTGGSENDSFDIGNDYRTDPTIYPYPYSNYPLEQNGGNENEIGSYSVEYEDTYEYSYDESLLENYMDTIITYTIGSDNNSLNGQVVTISKKIPLTIDSRILDDFYIFKGAIRSLDNFNPLQLDLKSDTVVMTIDSKTTLNDVFGSTALNDVKNWQSEFEDNNHYIIYDDNNPEEIVGIINKTTKKGYPQAMLDAMKAGITGEILTQFSSLSSSGLEEVLENGSSFNIEEITAELLAGQGYTGFYTYQNLYYYVCDDKIDDLFKYESHDYSNHLKFTDITGRVSYNLDSNGAVSFSISLNLSDINQTSKILSAKSFIVLYRSNESLGVWEGAGNANPDEYDDESNLHFVFGVNYDDNASRTFIKITPFLLQSRDRRVFDKEHRCKGSLDDDN